MTASSASSASSAAAGDLKADLAQHLKACAALEAVNLAVPGALLGRVKEIEQSLEAEQERAGPDSGADSSDLGEHQYGQDVIRVLKQVHPNMSILEHAHAIVMDIGLAVMESILKAAITIVDGTDMAATSNQPLIAATRMYLTGELAKHAVSEATKACTKFRASFDQPASGAAKSSKTSKAAGDRSAEKRAGLVMDLNRCHRVAVAILADAGLNTQIPAESVVALAAIQEYIIAEVLELAGNAARDNRASFVTPRHIRLAIMPDEELNDCFGGWSWANVGDPFYMPRTHLNALPWRNAGKAMPAYFVDGDGQDDDSSKRSALLVGNVDPSPLALRSSNMELCIASLETMHLNNAEAFHEEREHGKCRLAMAAVTTLRSVRQKLTVGSRSSGSDSPAEPPALVLPQAVVVDQMVGLSLVPHRATENAVQENGGSDAASDSESDTDEGDEEYEPAGGEPEPYSPDENGWTVADADEIEYDDDADDLEGEAHNRAIAMRPALCTKFEGFYEAFAVPKESDEGSNQYMAQRPHIEQAHTSRPGRGAGAAAIAMTQTQVQLLAVRASVIAMDSPSTTDALSAVLRAWLHSTLGAAHTRSGQPLVHAMADGSAEVWPTVPGADVIDSIRNKVVGLRPDQDAAAADVWRAGDCPDDSFFDVAGCLDGHDDPNPAVSSAGPDSALFRWQCKRQAVLDEHVYTHDLEESRCGAWQLDEIPAGAQMAVHGVRPSVLLKRSISELRSAGVGPSGLVLPKRWFQSAVLQTAAAVFNRDVWIPRIAVCALQIAAEAHMVQLLQATLLVVMSEQGNLMTGHAVQRVVGVFEPQPPNAKHDSMTALSPAAFASKFGGRVSTVGDINGEEAIGPDESPLIRWLRPDNEEGDDDTAILVAQTLAAQESQSQSAEPIPDALLMPEPLGTRMAAQSTRTVARLLGHEQPRHCVNPTVMAHRIITVMHDITSNFKISAQALTMIQLVVEARVVKPLAAAVELRGQLAAVVSSKNLTKLFARAATPESGGYDPTAPADEAGEEVLLNLFGQLDDAGWEIGSPEASLPALIQPKDVQLGRRLYGERS